mmetsp:Transcript_79176/g.214399  ORF Transcript_79176/g.214399 Transcript_79176/m.214399 type:complete len:204 (+) Transcript_79176:173-784(+)
MVRILPKVRAGMDGGGKPDEREKGLHRRGRQAGDGEVLENQLCCLRGRLPTSPGLRVPLRAPLQARRLLRGVPRAADPGGHRRVPGGRPGRLEGQHADEPAAPHDVQRRLRGVWDAGGASSAWPLLPAGAGYRGPERESGPHERVPPREAPVLWRPGPDRSEGPGEDPAGHGEAAESARREEVCRGAFSRGPPAQPRGRQHVR